MADTYKVTGAVAVLPMKSGSERYLYQGAEFTGDDFSAQGIKHAIAAGLIKKVAKRAAATAAPVAPESTGSESSDSATSDTEASETDTEASETDTAPAEPAVAAPKRTRK